MSDIYTQNFTEIHEPGGTLHSANRAANTYDTAWLPMRDHQRIVFLVDVGVIAAGGTVDFEVRQATSVAGAGATNVFPNAGFIRMTQLTQAAGDGNDSVAVEVRTEQMDVDGGYAFLSGRLTVAVNTAYTCVIPLRLGTNYPPVPTTGWTEVVLS
jgi:hypothetical protein